MLHRLSKIAGFIDCITHYTLTSLKALWTHQSTGHPQQNWAPITYGAAGLTHIECEIVSQDALRITEHSSGPRCGHDRSYTNSQGSFVMKAAL